MNDFRTRLCRQGAAVAAVALLTPMVIWPGFTDPFGLPKTLVLLVALPILTAVRIGREPLRTAFDGPLLLVCAGFAIAAPWAFDVQRALIGALVPLAALVLLRGVARSPAGGGSGIRTTASALALGTFVGGSMVLLQALGVDVLAGLGFVLVGPRPEGRLGFYGLAGNPDFAAAAALALFPLGRILALRGRAIHRAIGTALHVVALGVIAVTASFAALLGMLVYFLSKTPRLRRAIVFVVLLGSFVLANPLRSPVSGGFLARFAGLRSVLETRAFLWAGDLEVATKAFPFGVGAGNLPAHHLGKSVARVENDPERWSRRQVPTTDAHSDGLGLLAEGGLLGFAGYVWLLGALFFGRPGTVEGEYARRGALAFATVGLFTNVLDRAVLLMPFAVLLGMVANTSRDDRQGEEAFTPGARASRPREGGTSPRASAGGTPAPPGVGFAPWCALAASLTAVAFVVWPFASTDRLLARGLAELGAEVEPFSLIAAFEAQPGRPSIQGWMGAHLLALGNVEGARSLLRRAAPRSAEPGFYLNLARAELRLENPRAARSAARFARLADPSGPLVPEIVRLESDIEIATTLLAFRLGVAGNDPALAVRAFHALVRLEFRADRLPAYLIGPGLRLSARLASDGDPRSIAVFSNTLSILLFRALTP